MVVRHFKRAAMLGTAVVGLQAAYAVLRPSPDQPDFDPTGLFGDSSSPPLRIAVLGDSSVTAPGVAGPEEIWISLVCERLATDYHVELRSFAVGGSKADDLIANQMADAIAYSPDVIFVSVGANDALKGVPRKRFERHLDLLITRLVETGATVIQSGVGELGSIPRLFPPLSTMISRRARQFDDVHWKIAENRGTVVVDQRSDDIHIWYRDRDLWSPDLFHVSAAGHARWADTAWKTVEPLVNGTSGSSS